MSRKTPEEIERMANRFLEASLENIFDLFQLKIRPYDTHKVKERGLDFIFEIEKANFNEHSLENPAGALQFYLQNKGQLSAVKQLKTTDKKGLISFQLEKASTLEYLVLECDQPTIITLCDLQSNDIYWLPMQINTEDYVNTIASVKKAYADNERLTKTVRIYFDPANCLIKNGQPVQAAAERFIRDINLMKTYLVRRHLKAEKKSNKTAKTTGSLIDRNKPFEYQVLQYLKAQQEELAYYPVHQLIADYPLESDSAKTKNEYYQLTLQSANSTLLEYFKDLTGSEYRTVGEVNELDQTRSYTDDQRELLRRFNQNLIHFIEDASTRKRIDIRLFGDAKCACVRCTHNRFEIGSLVEKLKDKTDEIQDEMKRGYYLYKTGMFPESVSVFLALLPRAKKQKKKTLQFVIEYNLSKLATFIRNYSYKESNHKEVLKKLSSWDLDQSVLNCTTDQNQSLLEWIKDNKFYEDVADKIRETNLKIQEQYQASLRGGSSSNNYIDTIYTRFICLQHFLERNCVIYDEFSEYQELGETFIDALLTSYSIDKTHTSRIERFNEFILRICVQYGKADSCLKIISRGRIEEVEIDIDSDWEDECITFLRQVCELQESPTSPFSGDNYFFRRTCEKQLTNFLLFASYVKITATSVNTIIELLIRFLKSPNRKTWLDSRYLRIYLHKKGNDIETRLLTNLIELCYSDNRLLTDGMTDAAARVLQKRHAQITISDEILKSDLVNGKDADHYCESLIDVHDITDQITQRRISQIVDWKLNEKFNGSIFYVAVLFDVIKLTEERFNDFIKYSEIKESTVSANYLFGSTKKRYPKLGDLINLCFKFDVDLTSGRFKHFRGIHPYYDWLMNMEGFNYEEFDPTWLLDYQTKFYFAQFRKVPAIRQALVNHLRKNRDERLEKLFFDLTVND
jgi:hypothetical protein